MACHGSMVAQSDIQSGPLPGYHYGGGTRQPLLLSLPSTALWDYFCHLYRLCGFYCSYHPAAEDPMADNNCQEITCCYLVTWDRDWVA